MRVKRTAFPCEWMLLPILNTCNQYCLKTLSATAEGLAWLVRPRAWPWCAAVVICEVLTFLLWMRILSSTSVSRAVPLTAVSYFFIMMMGWTLFHEVMLASEIAGSGLILAGMWLLCTE